VSGKNLRELFPKSQDPYSFLKGEIISTRKKVEKAALAASMLIAVSGAASLAGREQTGNHGEKQSGLRSKPETRYNARKLLCTQQKNVSLGGRSSAASQARWASTAGSAAAPCRVLTKAIVSQPASYRSSRDLGTVKRISAVAGLRIDE
jgi:hypothetical protein